MGHQKLHLIGQNPPIAQDKVFPQTGHIGRVQQRHAGLLGRAVAFAVIAAATRGDHVHPGVHAFLRKRHDVLAREFGLVKGRAAVSADIAVAGEQFVIGQAGAQVKRVDLGHAPRANDAVDADDGLPARDRVVATVKHRDFTPGLPTHLFGGVIHDRLLQTDPRLGQSLG